MKRKEVEIGSDVVELFCVVDLEDIVASPDDGYDVTDDDVETLDVPE